MYVNLILTFRPTHKTYQASGRIGSHFVEELLKTGKHTITALTHANSKGTLPAGVQIAQVSYDNDDEDSLVTALQGQQFLIITLSVRAPPDTHTKLVHAAAKAGVPYIMPNAYGTDFQNASLREENLATAGAFRNCVQVESLGASSYIGMVCGMWYEWSLALGEPWFGFDIKNKTVTFFDDGKTRINVSTWRQCGRALATLLSLPESGTEPAVVERWKNKALYVASFRVSQRDMLNSIHRVTGTADKDWEIKYESTAERYKNGNEELKKGSMVGFAKALYARVFFPNGDGDFESSRGLANELLGLPKEDLDEATKRTVEMVENGWDNPFAH